MNILKNLALLLTLIALVTSGYFIYSRIVPPTGGDKPVEKTPVSETTVNQRADAEIKDVKYKVELVAQNLFVPWSIIFTSPNRILFTERNGSIKELKNGTVNETPLITFDQVSTIAEEGLMGLAVDPEYNKNKLLYASYAYTKGDELFVKVVNLLDEDSKISEKGVIIDNIPAAKFHAGSRIKFGPDKKLYITTGDGLNKSSAQDINKLSGKILRINPNGTFPADNPFNNSPVYSYGHRNPQGIDWHPKYGYLVSTEHGPSVVDGPPGGDEINIINPGKNYGWPLIHHDESRFGLESPLLQYTPAVAPASGVFYNSDLIPQFRDTYFFGGLAGEGIYWIKFDQYRGILDKGKLPEVDMGRIRDIAVSPNGELYFSTSNRDGRGNARENDDKIYKITKVD